MPDPLPPPDPAARPSLAGQLLRRRPQPLLALACVAAAVSAAGTAAVLHRGTRPAPSPAAGVRPAIPAPAEPVAATLAAMARVLPPAARLVRLDRRADGTLAAEVETTEPDRLRAALAADAALPRLRTVTETALPDGGYRVALEQRQ